MKSLEKQIRLTDERNNWAQLIWLAVLYASNIPYSRVTGIVNEKKDNCFIPVITYRILKLLL